MSMAGPYLSSPRSSSGGRYQSVITLFVYSLSLSSASYRRASPQSPSFIWPLKQITLCYRDGRHLKAGTRISFLVVKNLAKIGQKFETISIMLITYPFFFHPLLLPVFKSKLLELHAREKIWKIWNSERQTWWCEEILLLSMPSWRWFYHFHPRRHCPIQSTVNKINNSFLKRILDWPVIQQYIGTLDVSMQEVLPMAIVQAVQ